MKVIPLSYSQVNWSDFIMLSKTVVGRSPTASLDACNIGPGDPFSYIAALEELIEPTSPRDAVLQATYTLEHVSFSFIAYITEDDLPFLRNVPVLKTTLIEGKIEKKTAHYLLLLTGNLLEWKMALPLMLAAKEATNDTFVQRELFSQIFTWFKRMNLRELFDRYTEVATSDGFFRLERK